jgi:ferrochelatase
MVRAPMPAAAMPASMPSAPATTAVLLVNLGTPDAPTPRAVRRYLGEFLLDPRVVQLPRWLWEPLLRLVILPLRAKRVARKYAEIWLPGGSPLAVYAEGLAAAVQERLPGLRVAHAMRYGTPGLAATLAALRRDGVRRVLVLPLYPQYSTTTTASVTDVVLHAPGPEARVVADYHLDPDWIEAIAASVEAHWAAHGRGERLLLSFHGIPQRLVDGGDPYAAQCVASVEAIARRLGLAADEHVLAYQSRFGREPWLLPATSDTLAALAAQGVREVDVVCPGFAVDCLETLEEIAQEDAEAFRAAGGARLRYIPCLNAAPAHARALAGIVQQELAQWP